MKKINLKTCTRFPYEGKEWLSSARCTGLRENSSTTLTLDPSPDEVGRLPVSHSLIYIDLFGGKEMFITVSGSQLYLWAQRDAGGYVEVKKPVTSVPSGVKRIVRVGEFLVVHCADALIYLKYLSGNYHRIDMSEAVPCIYFKATDVATHSLNSPAITFPNQVTSWRGQLDEKNLAAVRSRSEKAFSELFSDARSRGEFSQPQLVRFAVRTFDNSIIYASAPVIVGVGLQGGNAVVSDAVSENGVYTGVSEATFDIDTFAIELNCMQGVEQDWLDYVKSVDILAATVDNPATDFIRHTLNTPTVGQHTLSVTMQLASESDYVRSALATKQWRKLASFSPRELSSGTGVVIKDSDKTADSTLCTTSQLDTAAGNFLQMRIPKAITATAGMVHFVGGSSSILPVWNPAELFAGKLNDEACSVNVTVISNLGGIFERKSYTYQFDYTPSHLSPVLPVPGKDATSLLLQIYSPAGYFRGEYPLYMAAGSDCCYYQGSGLSAIALDYTDDGMITSLPDIEGEQESDSRIVTSVPGNPFAVRSDVNLGLSDIIDVAPAYSPVSSGLFNQMPLYIFTSAGVYLCTYEPLVSVARMPRRITMVRLCDSADAVVATPKATYFTDGCSLFSLASGKCCTVLPCFDARKMLYRSDTDEIFALVSDGSLMIFNNKFRYRTVDDLCVVAILPGASGSVYVVSGTGAILHFSAYNTHRQSHLDIRSHPIECNHPVNSVKWKVYGRNMNLKLTVYGLAGNADSPYLLSSYSMKGSFHVPVTTPVSAPFFSDIALEIKGTADDSLIIYPVIINPKD